MPACSAVNCKSRWIKDSGKSFHSFPHRDPSLLRRWLSNLHRKDFKPLKTSSLCSDHFEESCFDRTQQKVTLREGSVPTIFNLPKHLLTVFVRTEATLSLPGLTRLVYSLTRVNCYDATPLVLSKDEQQTNRCWKSTFYQITQRHSVSVRLVVTKHFRATRHHTEHTSTSHQTRQTDKRQAITTTSCMTTLTSLRHRDVIISKTLRWRQSLTLALLYNDCAKLRFSIFHIRSLLL